MLCVLIQSDHTPVNATKDFRELGYFNYIVLVRSNGIIGGYFVYTHALILRVPTDDDAER